MGMMRTKRSRKVSTHILSNKREVSIVTLEVIFS
jgi:hypothetical protein